MSAPTQAPPRAAAVDAPVASADRRFHAFVLDRLASWSILGVAGLVAWLLWLSDGQVWPGVGLVCGVGVVSVLVQAVVLGSTGATPGKAALGLRVVDHGTGTPIGLGPALLRTVLVGVATLPTFGLGAAVLAWSALIDPQGRRRGLHDRAAHTVVVDVRPPAAETEVTDEPGPRHIVNLTALRLKPAPVEVSRPATQVAAPRQRTGAPWRISFDTGEAVVVTGLVLIGRGPTPRSGEEVQEAVRLRSDDMSVSKTHAQVHLARDGAVVVMDRGSTNGSTLLRRGVSRGLPAGRPTTLLSGDRVRFGDREMLVEQAAPVSG